MQSVLALDPQPAEVVVATDKELVLPQGWKQIPAAEPYFFESWNQVFSAASGPYIAFLSMDDTMPPDALADLVLEGDVIVSGLVHSNGVVSIPTKDKYDNIFNENEYPLVGCLIYHKSVFDRVKLRPITWTDWVAALEYKHLGFDIRFDSKVRYVYSVHAGQHSRRDAEQGERAIAFMKEHLPIGRVVHDGSWPPRLL